MSCVFCEHSSRGSEKVILSNDVCRVILVADKYYPGYIQIISNSHVKELTDLSSDNALIVFNTILHMEKTIRKIFNPDKVNIASLGNVVPHLHWHIIPRYFNDRHFPNPVWGEILNPEYLPDSHLHRCMTTLIGI